MTTFEPVKTKSLRSTVELVLIVAAALFFALTLQALAVKPYRIPSGSMLPTLKPGQRIIVDRFSHRIGTDPKLGDVTVFYPPHGADTSDCGIKGEGPFYSGGPATRHACTMPTRTHSDTTFVKRVVGLPGDRIAIINGHVYRNGNAAKEPFASSCAGAECNLNPMTVPRGMYFLMGDNRGNSDDSRFWGPVPRDWIIGKAVVSYWPPRSVGAL
jgi:signal peptidase I